MIYFGLTLQNRLEEAGHKPGKEEKKAQRAREKILDQVFDSSRGKDGKPNQGFADPAAMFAN